MKLAKLRIRNFRCYAHEITIDFDDLTAFVGRNDVGKSTIMDALDIFLNDGAPDKNDASKSGDGKDLTIICEFSDLPAEAVIDEDAPTSFSSEFLLNSHGRLEIHKTYSGHTATPKCTNIAAFAVHPTADKVADLLQLKNADLKKRAKDLNLDLSGVDSKVNAQLRSCIRESVKDLNRQPTLIPLNEDNAKKAWEGIKTIIPIFALFKSDRASTDQDPEAQDPLKNAVKEALKQKQKEKELNAIVSHVEREVKQIAEKTLEKLREMDASLAQQLNPQFTLPKWESLFKATITGDDDIPINKRGSGVKRLILLNFFRAKAEQQALQDDVPVVYGIEEPETSQHPHNQRLLVSALLDLAVDHQVVITTHTPMLARTLPNKCLRYIHVQDDRNRGVMTGSEETNRHLAKSLGVLPDHTVRLFIGVEGRHDIAFLKSISKVLVAGGVRVLDLEKMELDGELIFFPLGGSSLALWTSRLKNLGRPEFHLYDRDTAPPAPARYQGAADEVNLREGCRAMITGKKEMENYLHFDAINEAYAANQITLGLTENFEGFDDVPMSVAERVHVLSGSQQAWADLSQDKQKQKCSSAKAILNSKAAALMTIEKLRQSDSDNEIQGWFQTLSELNDFQ